MNNPAFIDTERRVLSSHPRWTQVLSRLVMRFLFLLVVSCTLSACDETLDSIKSLDNIKVPIVTSATIEKGNTLDMVLGGFPQLDAFTRVDLSQQQAFDETGHSVEDVDKITLDRITMTVTTPESPDGDLSFLGAMRFYLQADELPKIEVATTQAPMAGQRVINFETVNDDLKSYLLGGGEITIEVDDATRPERDTTIEIEVIFDIDINVI